MDHERPMSLIDEDRQPQGALGDAETFNEKADGIGLLEDLLTNTLVQQAPFPAAHQTAWQQVRHLRDNQIRQVLQALSQKSKEIQSMDETPTRTLVDELSALVAVLGRLTGVPPETA